MKFYILIVIFVIIVARCFGQANFQLKIKSNYYKENDKIFLSTAIFDSDFNEIKIDTISKFFTVPISFSGDSFTVNGNLKYPQLLVIQNVVFDENKTYGYNSYPFFVEQGIIDLSIKNLQKDKFVVTSKLSKSNKEFLELQKLYKNCIDKDGIIVNFSEKLKIVNSYIKRHPNSYVALWSLAYDYVYYKPQNKEIKELKTIKELLNKFSQKIKATKTHKALCEKIIKEIELREKAIFPNLTFSGDELYNLFSNDNFTLIDFWFSGCAPCIAQFPKYKRIYEKYKDKDFEIIGISTDTTKNKKNWEKVLQKQQLPWLQYLDENGKEAGKLNIHKFPTNFLVDAQGKIIQKDISPESLEQFLAEHLK